MRIEYCPQCGFAYCPDLAGDVIEHLKHCRQIKGNRQRYKGFLGTYNEQEQVKRRGWNLIFSSAALPLKTQGAIWILWAWYSRAVNRKRTAGSFEKYIKEQLQRDPEVFPPEVMDSLCEMYGGNCSINIVTH